MAQMTKCSYWQRQEFRDATDTGFGMHPFSIMKPDDIEKAELARDSEDIQDPPCKKCETCIDSEKPSEDWPDYNDASDFGRERG